MKTVELKVVQTIYSNAIEHRYFLNDKLHNEFGPAFKQYYSNGNIHQESYYINNLLHREMGPAVINYSSNGSIDYEKYYLNDSLYFKKDWEKELIKMNTKASSCHGKVVEIDGKKYTLSEVV